MRVHLIRIDAQDAAGDDFALRLTSVDDERGCYLDNAEWLPAIARLPSLAYDFFGGAFQNAIAVPQAEFEVASEVIEYLADLRFAAARMRFWSGELGDDFTRFTLHFDGRIAEEPRRSAGRAVFAARPDDRWLDLPLLQTYAGTGGIEGNEDLTGTVKPLVLGNCQFVPGVLIDAVDNVYQLSAYGAITAVAAVFDRLNSLGTALSDHADLAALLAATIAPGQWATCLAQGLVRLGAPADGKVSFHVSGDAAGAGGYVRRAGGMIARVADIAGGAVSAANVAALDAARPWNLSLVLAAQMTARQVVQEIADSVAAVAGISWSGELFVQAFAFSEATTVLDAAGGYEPLVAEVSQQAIASPFWRLATHAEVSWVVYDNAEIATEYVLRGPYSAARTYRLDDMVFAADGRGFIYIDAAPSAGNAPPTVPATSNTWWELFGAATAGAPSGTDVAGLDADTVAATILPSGEIATDKVVTDSVVENAITDTGGSFTAGLTALGTSYSDVQSFTITTDGSPVLILYSLAWQFITDNAKGDCAVYRGASALVVLGEITVNSGENPTTAGTYLDAPAAGTYTYYLKAKANASGQIGVANRGLFPLEFKK